MKIIRAALLMLTVFAAAQGLAEQNSAEAQSPYQLVFGSFQSMQNATNWASRLSLRLKTVIVAEAFERDEGIWYRVAQSAAARRACPGG